jgi:hypothetical protein
MSENLDFLAITEYEDMLKINRKAVNELFDRYFKLGYQMVDGYAWLFSNPDNLISDKKLIKKHVDTAFENKNNTPNFYFWKFPFEFSISLDTSESKMWILSTKIDVLVGVDHTLGFENSRRLIEVIRETIKVFPPYFGCGYSEDEEMSFIDPDEEFKSNNVFDINYFSSRYKELHDKKGNINKSLAEIVENVANGTLLIPSINGIYSLDKNLKNSIKSSLI